MQIFIMQITQGVEINDIYSGLKYCLFGKGNIKTGNTGKNHFLVSSNFIASVKIDNK